MSENNKRSKTGMIIGAVFVIVAILGVIFIKLKPAVEEEIDYVRPIKPYPIGELETVSSWKYTGRVRPNEEVQLGFEVNGVVTELLVKKGEDVEKGQPLARLDPRDYQNNLNAAKARKTRAEAYRDRMKQAYDKNAVSQQEYDDAIAQYEVAESELSIAEKAMEDTVLHARFKGMVADIYIDQFENVRAKQNILALHDVTTVEIVADISEKRVFFSSESDRGKYRHTASFEYLSDEEFDLTLKEYSTEADPDTQTYRVMFTMPQPKVEEGEKEIRLFGGMSVTVLEYNLHAKDVNNSGYLIPLSAAAIDSEGQYYVWLLDDDGKGNATAKKMYVKTRTFSEKYLVVVSGVEKGDLIASAGIYFLRDGQQVRIMK